MNGEKLYFEILDVKKNLNITFVREKLFDMHSDYTRSKIENIWIIQILGKDKKKGVSIK